MRLKKIALGIALTPVALVLLVYLSFSIYFVWSEWTLRPSKVELPGTFSRIQKPHRITLIDDGLASLAHRLKLIRSAKSSLELEFFIFELDESSRIITHELILASLRGVRVRLLVDFAAPVFKLKPLYAQHLQAQGIDVRYYNTVQTIRFISAQHRSHRKLLIVDDKKVITGGRNIGNEYFNLAPDYNFLDSDVLVEGPMAIDIRKSFDEYWNSTLASKPDLASDSEEMTSDPDEGIRIRVHDFEVIKKIELLEPDVMASSPSAQCDDLTFVSDLPGVLPSNRKVYHHLSQFLLEASDQVVGESPYFVVKGDGLQLIRDLSTKGIRQKVLTNGLRSTDAYYTISAMLRSLDDLEQIEFEMFVYTGDPHPESQTLDRPANGRWGVHAKRAVIDQRHLLIGTYNVDPRSANLNSELILICRNAPELAQLTLSSILSRKKNARSVFGQKQSPLTQLTQGASFDQQVKFILARPLARLFDFLL